MTQKRSNPIFSMLAILLYTAIANLLNFISALEGGGVSSLGLLATFAFVGLWCWQVSSALRRGNRFFGYFALGYWLAGLVLYWTSYFSITFAIEALAPFGVLGMLMLYVPLYALVAILRYYLHIDYYLAFTLAFVLAYALLAGVFFTTGRMVARQKQQEEQMERLAEELQAEQPPELPPPPTEDDMPDEQPPPQQEV